MDSQRTLSLSDKPVRLSVQTVPEKVTEHYTLVWESSDPEVVRIAVSYTHLTLPTIA